MNHLLKWKVNWTLSRPYRNIRVVPSLPKSPALSAGAKAAMPFEEALQKLEGIVEEMESDELPLETLLAKYEEGTKLAKVCQEKLSEAEVKIAQLEKTAGGEFKLKPLASEPMDE